MIKTEAQVDRRVVGSYDMNRILGDSELSDDDKVRLVDLWTAYHAVRRELETLRQLISAVKKDEVLPY